MTDERPLTTVLAFDFGLKRIGVAVGQTVSKSASPIGTFSGEPKARQVWVNQLLREWRPDKLLLGDPVASKASKSLKREIQRFAEFLQASGLPLEFVDESMSSQEASERLRDQRQNGLRRKTRKEDIDAEAARLIAERWLSIHV
ncbi:MAG: Holliday junction resolvase RuvX [Pseudomonadota bacterium]